MPFDPRSGKDRWHAEGTPADAASNNLAMEEVVEYQVERISLAQSHHLQPLLLVGGVDHLAAIYKI